MLTKDELFNINGGGIIALKLINIFCMNISKYVLKYIKK